MPIAPLLQRFVDDELALAPGLIDRCLAGTLNLLRDTKSAPSTDERTQQINLVDSLQRYSAPYRDTFLQALRRHVNEELEQQQGGGVEAGSGFSGLELMDESRVDVDIEISRAMQLIDSTAEWELRELQTFTSTLIGQTHVTAESNPFRPLVYASALWDAACVVTPSQGLRALLLRTSAGVAAGLLKNAWAAASTRLESQGIEPGIYRTVLLASGSTPGRSAGAGSASGGFGGGASGSASGGASSGGSAGGAGGFGGGSGSGFAPGGSGYGGGVSAGLAALLASLPGVASRGTGDISIGGNLRNATTGARSPGSPSGGGVGLDLNLGLSALGAEFEQALQRLDEALRHLPAAAFAPSGAQPLTQPAPLSPAERDEVTAASKRMNAHRAALLASAGVSNERQIIELMTRLFDTLLSDSQLPAPLHATVARLQVPAMRLALRDRGLLESTSHPLWQLIDRVGLVAAARQPSDPRTQSLREFGEGLADELARGGTPDTTACRRALDRLEAFLADQLSKQLSAAQSSLESLQFSERREKLEQTLVQRLADQLAPMKLSASIRRFMLGTWAKVLAESMLRLGDQNETTRGYVKLVDDLTWSLQLPDHPQSRQRLVALLPGLLQRLRAGMTLVALPAPEQQVVLDELMTVHTEALRPGTRASTELTPEQIVQRMRDEVTPESPAAQAFSDSVIDLSSLETVPAELMSNDAATRAEDPARRVDALRVGEFARLFVQGRWQRVQLLWRSDHGLFFLFAGETPNRTHSIARRALERLAGAGLIQPLQQRTIMQRAIDTLSREIALPAT